MADNRNPSPDRGQVISTAAEVYEEFFVPVLFGQWPPALLDVAAVTNGLRVLDVGRGTGVLARAALDRVGPTGEVVGLDPNEGMLAVARRVCPAADWRAGAAEDLPFPAWSFDRVVSQFALMFFEDHHRALSEIARVLVPGGRLALATWAAIDESPGYAAMAQLLRRLFGAPAESALLAPFTLGDEQTLRTTIEPVFPDVAITRHDGVARFASIDAWVHTEIRGWTLADKIDDHNYRHLVAVAREDLASFANHNGHVAFPAPALIAAADSTKLSVAA